MKAKATRQTRRWPLFWVAYGLYAVLVVAMNVAALVPPSPGEPSRGAAVFKGLVLFPGVILSLLVHLLPGLPGGVPPAVNALVIVLGCLATPLFLVPLVRRWSRRQDDLEVIRQAAGIGPDWEVIFTAVAAGASLEHLCAGPAGPADMYHGERVRLRFTPTPIPGVEVAKCRSCRIAWVRAVHA